jgi:hypothetical protein
VCECSCGCDARAHCLSPSSELLGSFGDNELSPECLDGAQRFLKEETGISVPVSYTSYIAPISSSKLHQEVTSRAAIVLDDGQSH